MILLKSWWRWALFLKATVFSLYLFQNGRIAILRRAIDLAMFLCLLIKAVWVDIPLGIFKFIILARRKNLSSISQIRTFLSFSIPWTIGEVDLLTPALNLHRRKYFNGPTSKSLTKWRSWLNLRRLFISLRIIFVTWDFHLSRSFFMFLLSHFALFGGSERSKVCLWFWNASLPNKSMNSGPLILVLYLLRCSTPCGISLLALSLSLLTTRFHWLYLPRRRFCIL